VEQLENPMAKGDAEFQREIYRKLWIIHGRVRDANDLLISADNDLSKLFGMICDRWPAANDENDKHQAMVREAAE
jgi:hypothetical protein